MVEADLIDFVYSQHIQCQKHVVIANSQFDWYK